MQAAVQPAKASSSPPTPPREGEHADVVALARYGWLPCQVSLEIPVTNFTVQNLLNLRKGSIVETDFHYSADLPLKANGLFICWAEFEVIANRLAVRVTELA